jgi:hypothetical protein
MVIFMIDFIYICMKKGKSTLQCRIIMKDLVTIFLLFVSQILLYTTQMYLRYLLKNEMKNQNFLFLFFPL